MRVPRPRTHDRPRRVRNRRLWMKCHKIVAKDIWRRTRARDSVGREGGGLRPTRAGVHEQRAASRADRLSGNDLRRSRAVEHGLWPARRFAISAASSATSVESTAVGRQRDHRRQRAQHAPADLALGLVDAGEQQRLAVARRSPRCARRGSSCRSARGRRASCSAGRDGSPPAAASQGRRRRCSARGRARSRRRRRRARRLAVVGDDPRRAAHDGDDRQRRLVLDPQRPRRVEHRLRRTTGAEPERETASSREGGGLRPSRAGVRSRRGVARGPAHGRVAGHAALRNRTQFSPGRHKPLLPCLHHNHRGRS